MDASHIVFGGPADTFWHSILAEARKRLKVEDIVRVAKEKYPERSDELQDALSLYEASQSSGTRPRAVPSSDFHRIDLLPRAKDAMLASLRGCISLQESATSTEILRNLPFWSRLLELVDSGALDLEALINVCGDEPRGFATLLEGLQRYEPADVLSELCRCLDHLSPIEFPWQDLMDLKGLLGSVNVDSKSAHARYCEVLGEQKDLENGGTNAFLAGLDLLAGKVGDQFWRYLFGSLHSANHTLSSATWDLLEGIAERSRTRRDIKVLWQSVVASTVATSASLLITVEPAIDASNESRLMLSARVQEGDLEPGGLWLQHNEQSVDTVSLSADLPPPKVKSQLEDFFREFVEAAWGQVGSRTLAIGMCLPVLFLDLQIEAFKISWGSEEDFAGRRYRLVLHSYERRHCTRFRPTHDAWWERWEGRPARGETLSNQQISWTSSPEECRQEILRSNPILVSLTPLGGAQCKCISSLIDHGYPAVLWLRRLPDDLSNAREKLEELLCAGDFEDLPERLFEKRSSTETEAFWTDVALLWDDPDNSLFHGSPTSP